jgi:DNA-binding MarR family transcriptional regulator
VPSPRSTTNPGGSLRPPTLLGLPSYLAGQVRRIASRQLVEELATRGYALPHFAVMAALGDFGPLPQHELADRIQFNRSHLVGYLDRLEDHGHVARTRDRNDRRRQHVALTDTGDRLRRDLIDTAHRTELKAISVLTDPERQTLVRLLQKVLDTADGAAGHQA